MSPTKKLGKLAVFGRALTNRSMVEGCRLCLEKEQTMKTEADTKRTRLKVKNKKLLVLFFMGVVLLNFPLLSLFSKKEITIFSVPLLYGFVFIVWGGLIGLTRWMIGYSYDSSIQSK